MPATKNSPAMAAGLIEKIISDESKQNTWEREIALLAFCAWLRRPNDVAYLEVAQLYAAGTTIGTLLAGSRHKSEAERLSREYFDAQAIGKVFQDIDKLVDYSGAFDPEFTEQNLECVRLIAYFFLRCPLALKPSFNKALYFIDEGGFTDGPFRATGLQDGKYSPATVKSAWKQFKNAAPFWTAAGCLDIALDLRPDRTESVRVARKLLASNKLSELFAIARQIHNHLLSRGCSYEGIRFPTSVQASQIRFVEFDKAQCRLVSEYKAIEFNPHLPGGARFKA